MRNRLALLICILGIVADALVFGVIFKGQELGFTDYILIGGVQALIITTFAWVLIGRERSS